MVPHCENFERPNEYAGMTEMRLDTLVAQDETSREHGILLQNENMELFSVKQKLNRQGTKPAYYATL